MENIEIKEVVKNVLIELGIVPQNIQPTNDIIGVKELLNILPFKKKTIYQKVRKNEIPVFKSNGNKKLFFSRVAIMEWLKAGRN